VGNTLLGPEGERGGVWGFDALQLAPAGCHQQLEGLDEVDQNFRWRVAGSLSFQRTKSPKHTTCNFDQHL